MRAKSILSSLFFSYAVTGISLLILAFLVFQFDLGEGPLAAGIVSVYVLSCLLGGFMAGKIMQKQKFLWGLLVGVSYFVLLLAVSFFTQGKWDVSAGHFFTTLCMCLGGGTLGGMLS